ncbi:MAG: glycine--tRNA ligase subunit beta, partial [Rhodobacteraceae bacterium]|nr:glycine--tRNA ligase subunit beta [Paracoccaceae bacterium]
MTDLLIELFSEEIPARMQTRAANDLKKLVTDGMVEAGLTYASAAAFSTPRRLTLTVEGMLDASPTTVEERKGPKADAPEKAIKGFLRGAGLTHDDLEERETPKGNIFFARITKEGRPAADIVAEVLERTIRNFPWPKSMRWGNGTLKWVRPLHSILCITSSEEGATVVPLEVDGIISGNTTHGHRFLSPDSILVNNFDDYTSKLKLAHVVLDAQERADAIWNDATNQAFATGFEVVEDAGLLAEVAGLVEWPVVLMGEIGKDFLGLPAEVLQTSMREHQKFFSVRNAKTGRIERFITVANRKTADNGATILAGNQKVLSARLADAKFFWENDLRVAKSDMSVWLKSLENVTFHNKLGTQAELVNRMATLARELAPAVGADPDMAEKAARFAKADLSSEMVYEFPELQGLMGRYYIEASGEGVEIAAAAEEHYAPLGPSDSVPKAAVSITVSLAEKLEKLNGFWSIDEKPTGSKDPFALRRAALGIIRIAIENDLAISLNTVMPTEHAKDLLSFFHDRLKVYLKDQGIRHDIIDACIAMDGNDNINLLVKRARALSETLKTDDGKNLIQGFKRANNILSQAEAADGVEYSYGADVKFAETGEERSLFGALDTSEVKIKPAMRAQDFATAMSAMATLRTPIDAFFEAVQINSDNPTVRRNRLNLLSRIRTVCS